MSGVSVRGLPSEVDPDFVESTREAPDTRRHERTEGSATEGCTRKLVASGYLKCQNGCRRWFDLSATPGLVE